MSVFLRRFASRGRGGVDSDRGVRRKWMPPRTPLAKRHSGVYRQEAAGWLRLRDLQKAWGLGREAREGIEQGSAFHRVFPARPNCLLNDILIFQSWIDCHRALLKLLWGYVHSHGRTCEVSL